MAHTHKKTSRSPILLTTLLASSMLLLSACGGNDGPPSSSAKPSDTGGNAATPARNNTSSSLLFASVNLVDAAGAPTGQKLVLVNPDTGAVAQEIAVDDLSDNKVAQSFTMSPDGLSSQAGDNRKLYYTNGGKLFEIDLLQTASPGKGRQVSSQGQICSVEQVLPKDALATTSWVVVSTAGADGACEFTDDNEAQLISSDLASSVPALKLTSKPRQVLRILDVQRDSQGRLGNLIGYLADVADELDKDGNKVSRFANLTLVSVAGNGLSTTLTELKPETDVNGDGVLDIPSITSFGKVAGNSAKVYLQIGQDIRVLSWESGAPVLEGPAVSRVETGAVSFLRTDGQATYFVDGAKLNKLGATGQVTLATLAGIQPEVETPGGDAPSPTDQVQPDGAMTTSTLLLVIRNGNNYSLRAVRKSDGVTTAVTLGGSTAIKVEAVNGDTAIISQAASAGEGGALWRLDASVASSSTPILPTRIPGTDHARVLTIVHGDTLTLPGESPATHVVWCDATKVCNPKTVNSYSLASGGNVLLSPGNITGTPLWGHAVAALGSTTLGLMRSSALPFEIRKDGAMVPSQLVSDSLWLFDAGAASSLKQVILPAN